MNGWIVSTDEGIITQDRTPVSDNEIRNDEITTDGVRVVLHWVYQGQYSDHAVDVDVFIRRDAGDEQNKATVEDVINAFEALEGVGRDHGADKLTALIDVEDSVMRAAGWTKDSSLSLATLNPFTSKKTWVKDL